MAYPNVAKCIISLNQLNYGWTETYYLDSPSSDLVNEMNALYTLAQKRILMCGEQTYIQWLKVSNEQTTRDVLVRNLGGPGVGALQATNGQDSDAPDTALLVTRVSSDNTKSSPLYLRGIRDSLFVLGGSFRFTDPGWVADFGAFKALLVATSPGWSFLAKSPSTPAKQDILSITPNAGGQLDFVVGPGNLFVGGAGGQIGKKVKVFVSGCQGCGNVNGQLLVKVNTVTSCTSVRAIPIFPYTGMGSMTNNIPAIFRIGDVRQNRVVERKVGRPPYLSRGRRPARQVG